MQTFQKKERLCNKDSISDLFTKGDSFIEQPFRIVWSKKEINTDYPAQTLIVVPKRNIKLATNRNIIKRRIKEAFRLNKSALYSTLSTKDKQINIAIIYQKQEIISYKLIEEKIKLTLNRLSENL